MIGKNRHLGFIWSKCRLISMVSLVAAALISFCIPQAHAMQFDLGPDGKLSWETTLSYAASMRLEKAKASYLADINGDDGNRAFEQYDLVFNRVTLGSEADLTFRNVGLFVRGRAFYDQAYNRDSANDSPETNNNFVAGRISSHQKFSDLVQEYCGKNAELLDHFIYGDFELFGNNLNFRVGDQVVNWGEAMFLTQAMMYRQAHLDFSKFRLPGKALKDLFLPSGQVYVQYDLGMNSAVKAYYQYEWKKHIFDPPGSFFWKVDYWDDPNDSGYLVAPGTIAFGQQSDVRDDSPGDFGVAFTHTLEKLNALELGFYYLNYTSRLPKIIFDAAGFHNEYQTDIPLYAFTVTTVLGNTNYSLEVNYIEDLELLLANGAYVESDELNVAATAFFNLGPVGFIDGVSFLVEVGMSQELDAPSGLAYDQFSWYLGGEIYLDFLRVGPSLDMQLKLGAEGGPNGRSSEDYYAENDHRAYGTLKFTYRSNLIFGFHYYTYLGDEVDSGREDRDIASFDITITW
jgi:uncharacterized protein DUF1302